RPFVQGRRSPATEEPMESVAPLALPATRRTEEHIHDGQQIESYRPLASSISAEERPAALRPSTSSKSAPGFGTCTTFIVGICRPSYFMPARRMLMTPLPSPAAHQQGAHSQTTPGVRWCVALHSQQDRSCR